KLSNRLLIEYNMGFTTYLAYHIVVVIDIEPIRERFSAVAPFLDERGRRLVAAAEAFAAGYGGIAAVAMASGVAPSTIGRGLQELAQDEPSERVRRAGAGRKRTISKSLPPRRRGTRCCFRISRRWSSPRPSPGQAGHAGIRDRRCGGPARACAAWRRRGTRKLTRSAAPGSPTHLLVAHLLDEAGYSLQGNRKTTEGDSHPDREAQFASINTQVTTALAEQQPVISVDTKKKEPVGDFRNPGREDCPQGNPEEVRV